MCQLLPHQPLVPQVPLSPDSHPLRQAQISSTILSTQIAFCFLTYAIHPASKTKMENDLCLHPGCFKGLKVETFSSGNLIFDHLTDQKAPGDLVYQFTFWRGCPEPPVAAESGV